MPLRCLNRTAVRPGSQASESLVSFSEQGVACSLRFSVHYCWSATSSQKWCCSLSWHSWGFMRITWNSVIYPEQVSQFFSYVALVTFKYFFLGIRNAMASLWLEQDLTARYRFDQSRPSLKIQATTVVSLNHEMGGLPVMMSISCSHHRLNCYALLFDYLLRITSRENDLIRRKYEPDLKFQTQNPLQVCTRLYCNGLESPVSSFRQCYDLTSENSALCLQFCPRTLFLSSKKFCWAG